MRTFVTGQPQTSEHGEVDLVEPGSNPNELLACNATLKLSDLPFYSNVLLLQGPVGPFFHKLSTHLQGRGSTVYKVNFNSGDDFFYPPKSPETIQYCHRLDYWPTFAHTLLLDRRIKAVFLFGDCRHIHESIKPFCQAYDIDLWVFEEGYFRPHFFTLEKGGVNFFSPITKCSMEEIIAKEGVSARPLPLVKEYINSYWYMVRYAITYWIVNIIFKNNYPNYSHHRLLNIKRCYFWVKSFFAYWIFQAKEGSVKRKIFQKSIFGDSSAQQFLMPLQVFDDSQITTHSDYESIQQFLEEVITSFSEHLYTQKTMDALIIKHHPMDRGQVNYQDTINRLGSMLNINAHLIYIHDIRLPSLFPVIDGCITINSTFGLQALSHGIPTINLGRSFYDKQGLTSQDNLMAFWHKRAPVNNEAANIFKSFVIRKSQVNGSLYAPEYQIT